MTVFDRLLRDVDDWLERLDRDRDRAARLGDRAWLEQLERERVRHLELVAALARLREGHHPALLLSSRPARATLAPRRLRRPA